MKLLFIDSNIFLDFYDFHDEDLDQLGKLVDLIKKKEIKLFLTTHVCKEIERNRENRLHEAYKKFNESNPSIPMPAFCKHYPEYSDIKFAQNLIQKIKFQLNKTLLADIENKNLKADKIIKALIQQSNVIVAEKYLDLAIIRHRLGNPPGKKDKSYGDELNWESLLAEVNENGDFIIISNDGDYASVFDESKLKEFLIREWKDLKKNDIYFYSSLTSFFNQNEIDINLRIEQEKNGLIAQLINSSSFLSTHSIIRELGKYASFSENQIKGLSVALLENDQVGGIIDDSDVNTFYKINFSDKSDMFTTAEWKSIQERIFPRDREDIITELANLGMQYPEQNKEAIVEEVPF